MRLLPRISTAVVAVLLVAGCTGSDPDTQPDPEPEPVRELTFSGPPEREAFGPEHLADIVVEVSADSSDPDVTPGIGDLRVHLDGQDRTTDADVDAASAEITWRPDELGDGEYHLAVVSDPRFDRDATPGEAFTSTGESSTAGNTDGDAGGADGDSAADGDGAADDHGAGTDAGSGTAEAAEPEVLAEWRVVVDTTPPELEVTEPDSVVSEAEPVTVAGTTEPGATVDVGDAEVTADAEGAFSHTFDVPPDGDVSVRAVDAAGNATEVTHPIATVRSRVTTEDGVRAVHVSFYGWASSLREPILGMIEDGRINAVQLDLKDEAGQIAYESQVPLAQQVGANLDIWDLEEAVDELHALEVPVIGRIVAFADPVLTRWAWENGERDWVIQTPGGDRYTGKYDGFSNFTHEDVIAYNIDVAEEAARAGVDHILWDYIRRPDGSTDTMVIPGLEGTPEAAVVEFTRRADERLAPYGVQHSASVFGIAADRPTQIGQDIPAMAEHLDYVSPMIYPSHWGPGEYGVADPNRQPYDIITATLEVWKESVEGRRARIVPWLEDTTYRAWNRPEQVREQIRATNDAGIDEWIMWDPLVDYTVGAYEPR